MEVLLRLFRQKLLRSKTRRQGGEKLKLNIGCGPTGQIDDYQNLDNSPSVILSKIPYLKIILYKVGLISDEQYKADWSRVMYCDASKRLSYIDESVDKIYSSHFLEHIPQEKGVCFLKECYRVLKKDGVMRLVVPDLLWHAERYVLRTKALLKDSELPDERSAHDTFLNSIYGAYLNSTRHGAAHFYMYDLPTVVWLLKSVGFNDIRKCEFREGTDQELALHDCRPDESLHLEVKK